MSNTRLQQENSMLAALALADVQPFDPSPPAPTHAVIDGIYDDHGKQTGNVAENGRTDDLRPTITGHVDGGANMEIRIWFNGVGPIEVMTDSKGNWSYTPDTDLLPNQEYYVQVSVLDPGSRQEIMSLPYHFYTTYDGQDDTSVPDAATNVTLTDNVKGGIVGELHNNDVTNDNTPTLSGKATAGDIINVYDHGVPVGSTTVKADGTWTFTPTALKDGEHSFTVAVQNPNNGAESPSTEAISVTVDTFCAVPEVAGVYDDVGSRQGLVVDGGKTDDNSVALTGTAEPGSTIYFTRYGANGATYKYSCVTDDEGHWSLPQGYGHRGWFNYSIYAVDAAGNKSATTTYKVEYVKSNQDDTSTPDMATDIHLTDNVAGGIVGDLKNGNITNDSTPTLSGKAEANDTIIIYDGNTQIGTTTVKADGSWSFTPSALNDGQHSFSVVVKNPVNGNLSNRTDAITVTIDTVCLTPAITYVDDDTGIKTGPVYDGEKTDDSKPKLHGTGEPGSTIKITMDGPVSGSTYTIGTVVVGADGKWTYAFSGKQALQTGDNVFHVVATDKAGNTAEGCEFHLIKVDTNQDDTSTPDMATDIHLTDNVAGGIVGDLKNGDLTNDNTPTLTGKATAGDTVVIYDGSKQIGTTTVKADGSWSFTPSAQKDGSHSYSVAVKDSANGQMSDKTTPIAVTVDTVCNAPVISYLTDNVGTKQGHVSNGGLTDDKMPEIHGTAEPNASVKIGLNGPSGYSTHIGYVQADENGNWSYQVPAAFAFTKTGTYTIQTRQTDEAGNGSDRSADFNIKYTGDGNNGDDTSTPEMATDIHLTDNVAGGIVGYLKNGELTNDNTPTLSGKATAGDTVVIYDGSKQIGTTKVASNGTWSFTPSAQSDGKHSYSVAVKDSANGHMSDKTTPIAVTVDTVCNAPVISYLTDNVGTQQGNVSNGGLTDDKLPEIHGTAEANSNVTLRVSGPGGQTYTLGTVHADSNGKWSFQMTTARAFGNTGNWTFSATAVDEAGNTSARSSSFVVKYTGDGNNGDDTSTVDAPHINSYTDDVGSSKGNDSSGGTTDDTTPTLNGTAPANSTVTIYEGSKVLGTVKAGSDGSWHYTVPAETEGKHTFSATATVGGKTSAHSSDFVINIDCAPVEPDAVHFSYLEDNYQYQQHIANGAVGAAGNDISPTLHGTGTPGQVIKIYQFDAGWQYYDPNRYVGSVTVGANGQWSYTAYTPDHGNGIMSHGADVYTWTFYSLDSKGNEVCVGGTGTYTMYGVSDYTSAGVIHDDTSGVNASIAAHGYKSTLQHSSAESADESHQLSAKADMHHTQLNAEDLLSQAATDLLINDGHQQAAIQGNEGDVIDLKVESLAENSWQDAGQITSGGVTYEVYQHQGDHVELLVQQGVDVHLVA